MRTKEIECIRQDLRDLFDVDISPAMIRRAYDLSGQLARFDTLCEGSGKWIIQYLREPDGLHPHIFEDVSTGDKIILQRRGRTEDIPRVARRFCATLNELYTGTPIFSAVCRYCGRRYIAITDGETEYPINRPEFRYYVGETTI